MQSPGGSSPHSRPCSAQATPDDPYEVTRARELNQLLGPKGSTEAFDLILDLHNTTANVGSCLIAESQQEVFVMHLCHHLQVVQPGRGMGGSGLTSPELRTVST